MSSRRQRDRGVGIGTLIERETEREGERVRERGGERGRERGRETESHRDRNVKTQRRKGNDVETGT